MTYLAILALPFWLACGLAGLGMYRFIRKLQREDSNS